MSGIVFINYRRSDAPGMAGRLFDRLEQDFPQDQLFFDVDNIPPGKDFVAYLNEKVEACDVLLAVVGPDWQRQLDAQDYAGGAQSEDFVRIEIEAALEQGKTVIPVLVSGAEMPRKEDLPESLHPFTRRNAVRLSHERFKADAAGITSALKTALAEAEEARAAAEADAARQRAEAERKAKAEREAKEEATKDAARREAATAGLSREEIAKAEELANWNFIAAQDDTQKLRDHLARFPDGVTASMASEKLEALVWRALDGKNDAAALDAFLEEFPDGPHAGDARARLDRLQKSEAEARDAKERAAKELAAWEAVKETTDPETFAAFLADWPNGAHAPEARRLKTALEGGSRSRLKVLLGAGAVAVFVAAIAATLGPQLVYHLQDSSLRTFNAGPVTSIAFAPDGRTALSVGRGGKLWDVTTGKELRSFGTEWANAEASAFTPDGRTAVAWLTHVKSSSDKPDSGTLKLWDVATGDELGTFEGEKFYARSVSLSPDARTALTTNADHGLALWDVETGRELRSFAPDVDAQFALLFPDGRTALSVSYPVLTLWDVTTGEALRTFVDQAHLVRAAAVSPDGRLVLTANSDNTLTLWDVATGKKLLTFAGHTGHVDAVAFAPDGRTALSAGWDELIKLWNVSTGKELRTFNGHQNWITTIAYAPDGRTALSGSSDGTMKLWDVAVEE